MEKTEAYLIKENKGIVKTFLGSTPEYLKLFVPDYFLMSSFNESIFYDFETPAREAIVGSLTYQDNADVLRKCGGLLGSGDLFVVETGIVETDALDLLVERMKNNSETKRKQINQTAKVLEQIRRQ